jgi:hypothetical protein
LGVGGWGLFLVDSKKNPEKSEKCNKIVAFALFSDFLERLKKQPLTPNPQPFNIRDIK